MTDLNSFLNYQAPALLLRNRIIVITGAGDGMLGGANGGSADVGGSGILVVAWMDRAFTWFTRACISGSILAITCCSILATT